ncbi:MAG TPA: FAD-binding protein, partial [Ktedonobacterales bacterium]|nr:FAD-binding protein [Ktedonobacterales bacterium]
QVRRGWNRLIDQHPALILVAANSQDVVAGVRFAREAGLGMGVQGTGHGVQHPADDHLLIVTSRMNAAHVDVQQQTARVEAGAIWKHVLDQATPHGLAPLLGTAPHVGVVGYTLGGGIGRLGRRYGFAADSVRWIDLVTADGMLRRASPTEHSDLFWGLRGGGGSFGVVTAMEFSLYPVATLFGGSLTYPGELAGDALRFFREWTKTVPDALTSSLMIVKFPALPQVPEAMRGQKQVVVRTAFAGASAQGEALMQPWLDWHTPLGNTLHEMPFSEVGTIQNDPVDPALAYASNEMLNDLSDEAIDVIVRHATDGATPVVFIELRHAGGALSRSSGNAIGDRGASFYMQMGGPIFALGRRAAMESAIRQCKQDLHPYLPGGVYLNFLSGDEARQRTRDAYEPATYERLLALKARYDPGNRFLFSYLLSAPGSVHP